MERRESDSASKEHHHTLTSPQSSRTTAALPSRPMSFQRPSITPTNTLILLLPPRLFDPSLLALFKAHFGTSYGTMVSWTALKGLGRVFVVYEEEHAAAEARREMDGFVWEDEDGDEDGAVEESCAISVTGGDEVVSNTPISDYERPLNFPASLRAFFGPQLTLPLPSLHSTLLSVPALSRNFLISPPGSPPIGWEQTLEEAPNRVAHAEGVDGGWAEELGRALRFLSVGEGADDDEDEDKGDEKGTVVIVKAEEGDQRPAVTLSAPGEKELARKAPSTGTGITSVKATIESMLGRRRSFTEADIVEAGEDRPKLGAPGRFIPTARPPPLPSTNGEEDF